MTDRVYSPGPALQVRDATRDDVPAILEIYNDAVLNSTATYDLEPVSLESRLVWFDAKSAAGWPVLVAAAPMAESTVLGWSTFGPFRDKAGYASTVEHSVYVRADCRGLGIGTALLQPLIDKAREAGHHVLVGGVDADNLGSVAFHERLGFERVGRFREVGRKFDRWLDVVFLQLVLD